MESKAIARLALRGTLWSLLGNYANVFVGFIAVLALTRLLTPDVFGLFALSTFWISILNLRSKIGLNYAALQQPVTDGRLLGTYFWLDLGLLCVTVLLVGIASVLFVLTKYSTEILTPLWFLILVDGILVTISPYGLALEREMQLSRISIVGTVSSSIGYVFGIAVALLNGQIWSLLIVGLITNILAVAGTLYFCRRRLPAIFQLKWSFETELAVTLLRVGTVTGFSSLMGTITTQFDNYLIGTFVGLNTLGFYDRAYRIASWPNNLFNLIIGRVGYLTMTKVSLDQIRLAHTVRLSWWLLALLGVPISIGLFWGADDLILLLYGSTWLQSAPYLKVLSIVVLLGSFTTVGYWLSVVRGNVRVTTGIPFIQALTMVVLATPLTITLGVPGTMIGVIAAVSIGFVLFLRYVASAVHLSPFQEFWHSGVAIAITCGLLWGLGQMRVLEDQPILVRLMLLGFAISGSYWPVFYLLRPIEMHQRLRYFRQRWAGENI